VKRLSAVHVGESIVLPRPGAEGQMTVEQAIEGRRSCRNYREDPLTLEQASRLLWAAQGITRPPYLRAAPSAGACYPLQTYLIAAEGIFRFAPQEHALVKTVDGDRRARLAQAALGQGFIAQAPVTIAFAAIYERTTRRYGDRGLRYVYMDVGAAAENVHLQAEALGLGSVSVGAFDDDAVAEVLDLPRGEAPVYLIPIGKREGEH
jgi:SagB-type dehydrogenase family enzyme